jgi:transposase
MAYIEGIARQQAILFPETVDDYIKEDNPVQFIDAFVDSLDLRALGFNHAQPQEIGRPPYNPADMLKLYLWGYLNRARSSRCLEKESHRNLEVMWLIKKLTPDFKTIADFRKDNKEAIKRVCREFTLLSKHLDLFGGELVAIDSSKFRAVNCKKRNFNQAKLEKRIREIEESIEGYFKELEANDNKEGSIEAIKAEELKAKIRWLKEKGEEYRALLNRLIDSGEIQISLTDPDSRAMMNNQRVEVS